MNNIVAICKFHTITLLPNSSLFIIHYLVCFVLFVCISLIELNWECISWDEFTNGIVSDVNYDDDNDFEYDVKALNW